MKQYYCTNDYDHDLFTLEAQISGKLLLTYDGNKQEKERDYHVQKIHDTVETVRCAVCGGEVVEVDEEGMVVMEYWYNIKDPFDWNITEEDTERAERNIEKLKFHLAESMQ